MHRAIPHPEVIERVEAADFRIEARGRDWFAVDLVDRQEAEALRRTLKALFSGDEHCFEIENFDGYLDTGERTTVVLQEQG